eukprot:6441491-Prymnesium_polylepis.2
MPAVSAIEVAVPAVKPAGAVLFGLRHAREATQQRGSAPADHFDCLHGGKADEVLVRPPESIHFKVDLKEARCSGEHRVDGELSSTARDQWLNQWWQIQRRERPSLGSSKLKDSSCCSWHQTMRVQAKSENDSAFELSNPAEKDPLENHGQRD